MLYSFPVDWTGDAVWSHVPFDAFIRVSELSAASVHMAVSVMLSHVMTGGVPKRQLFFLRTGTGSLCQQCYSVRSASLVPFVPITLVAFTVQFLLQKFAVRKCQSLLCHFYSVPISQTCCCTQRDVWCEIDCSMCSSSVWAGVCAPQAAAVCSKVMLTAFS